MKHTISIPQADVELEVYMPDPEIGERLIGQLMGGECPSFHLRIRRQNHRNQPAAWEMKGRFVVDLNEEGLLQAFMAWESDGLLAMPGTVDLPALFLRWAETMKRNSELVEENRRLREALNLPQPIVVTRPAE